MSRSPPDFWPTITALVGVILLTAAVFAPWGSIIWSYEYRAEQVTPSDDHLAERLGLVDSTATCIDACDLAEDVSADGPRVVSDATYRASYAFDSKHRLVVFQERNGPFYRPNITRYENDTVRVDLAPVSNATALELASTPAWRFPSAVERVAESGSVRAGHDLAGMALWKETQAIVAYDGGYAQYAGHTGRSGMDSATVIPRVGLAAAGALCCYYAGRLVS
ncbi:hypothetical protein NKF06_05185 [Haloferax sp. AB510]|uniref:hypothetical protein n=1 Tax=Haloferax sp. AB510 TaxID=2934172 RepID=UPI00209C6D29|nr:hypothetical protein [Haloferax sp. AB510]MCO8265990.1 hypothetical protein [Haloferax sp. AB510]